MRTALLHTAFALTFSCTVAAADSARQPDLLRGRLLHDDACTGCHGPSMYSRPYHERNPYFTVRKQVEIWQEFVELGWSKEQIDDVAHFVQKRYYDKPCVGDC
jgi:mono/diheme cytochrome c family protein